MYQVALKNCSWVLITDGVEFFSSNVDVRHHSQPPLVSQSEEKGTNRIYRISLTFGSMKSYCDSIEAQIYEKPKLLPLLYKVLVKCSLVGLVGWLIGGPFLALFVAVIVGWLSSDPDSSFDEEELKKVFRRAKENYEKWEIYFIQHEERLLDDQRKYLIKAQSNWTDYYRLRNFKSVESLTGVEFEKVVGSIYKSMGFNVIFTPTSGDYGVDVIAESNGKKIAIQAKRYSKPVGVSAVQEVASGSIFYKANKAVVISNTEFTENAKKLAGQLNVQLIGKRQLIPMWTKAFPEVDEPIFDLEIYESMKPEILKFLKKGINK